MLHVRVHVEGSSEWLLRIGTVAAITVIKSPSTCTPTLKPASLVPTTLVLTLNLQSGNSYELLVVRTVFYYYLALFEYRSYFSTYQQNQFTIFN